MKNKNQYKRETTKKLSKTRAAIITEKDIKVYKANNNEILDKN